MKEVESLLERSRKYLKSAKVLLNEGDFESSVSRVYYAMFFSAEALLLDKGLSFSSHKGVISAFGEHFVKTGIFSKEMSKELNRAFQKRQISDYDFSCSISEDDAKTTLEYGNTFVDTVINYLKNDTRR